MMIDEKTYGIIIKNYGSGTHNRCGREYNLGFGFIHYALIRNFRSKTVACIGSRKGFIPAMCALACKDNGKGKVYFVDPGYDRGEKSESKVAWGGTGVWKRATADYWKPLGIEDYIELQVTTIENYCEHNNGQRFQYIYLDADHSYEGVKNHFALLWPRLDTGGLFLLHDLVQIKKSLCGEFGVGRFVKELRDSNIGMELLTIPISAGLAVMRKL